jgi:hypothetical protein
MTLEQLNYINKVLTVDLKSFVLLEFEMILSEDYNLNVNQDVYLFILKVLDYRNILSDYKYNVVNNLYKKSMLPEPTQDLDKADFLSKSSVNKVAIIDSKSKVC